MLSKLHIQNFKCFSHCEIELSGLNLFCGPNSSGKSTAIQALLLIAHNAADNTSDLLNGQWLSLGSFSECRNIIKNAKQFNIAVEKGKEKFSLQFIQPADDTKDVESKKTGRSKALENLLDYKNKHIFHLGANRSGPSDYYVKNFDVHNFFGNKGEFVIDYFSKNQRKVLPEKMVCDPSSSTLSAQVNYWLEKILKVRLKVEDMGITNTLSAKFSYKDNKEVRPYHIGTGASYIVGVLIACLSAQQDDIVVVENPEIHLHPRAQADLTEFLCFISNAGVQIIVESHSDHIFNGIRKAVALNLIKNKNVAIHFFELTKDLLSENRKIELSEKGRIVNHVKGLFDQFDDDLDRILGL